MNEMKPCQLCGDTESDTECCAGCGRSVCLDCCRWLHDEDDEPCGDWFCIECEPENGTTTQG